MPAQRCPRCCRGQPVAVSAVVQAHQPSGAVRFPQPPYPIRGMCPASLWLPRGVGVGFQLPRSKLEPLATHDAPSPGSRNSSVSGTQPTRGQQRPCCAVAPCAPRAAMGPMSVAEDGCSSAKARHVHVQYGSGYRTYSGPHTSRGAMPAVRVCMLHCVMDPTNGPTGPDSSADCPARTAPSTPCPRASAPPWLNTRHGTHTATRLTAAAQRSAAPWQHLGSRLPPSPTCAANIPNSHLPEWPVLLAGPGFNHSGSPSQNE
jgi:hypothetical protein